MAQLQTVIGMEFSVLLSNSRMHVVTLVSGLFIDTSFFLAVQSRYLSKVNADQVKKK